MVKHNNILPNIHLRKHWQRWVKTFYNQPGRKRARLEARRAKAAQVAPRPLESLRPVVASCTSRYAGKPRVGKGFSLEELKSVGLTPAFARTIGIAVDFRRKNRTTQAFQRNVERLQAYKNRLVIIPRSSKGAKKGVQGVSWADSTTATADATYTQNTEDYVLPIPSVKRRLKGTIVTPAMNQFNAKYHMKQEITNKKWNGIREKRAAEAENK